jgi:hypothetical protein
LVALLVNTTGDRGRADGSDSDYGKRPEGEGYWAPIPPRYIGYPLEYRRIVAVPLPDPRSVADHLEARASHSAKKLVASGQLDGSRPLTAVDAFHPPPTGIFNGRLDYRFGNGCRLDALNLFHRTVERVERQLDHSEQAQRKCQREQNGLPPKASR